MNDKRQSKRVSSQSKVLDESARLRRIKMQREMLERDNYQDEPPEIEEDDMPKFEDKVEKKRTRKKKFKVRPVRLFADLLIDELEEREAKGDKSTNYLTANVPPSKYPPRHFCAVCGFKANYTCVQCGTRFCSINCQNVHKDTRCLKFTA